jgi:hypothetical protein
MKAQLMFLINLKCNSKTNKMTSVNHLWGYANDTIVKKVKSVPVQAWTGPEVSRTLRLPDFKTIGT